MRLHFDAQLARLNDEMIHMGSLMEVAIERATSGLLEQNQEKAKSVAGLEQEIDEKERDIEALCLRLLLQQQPKARDLREISAALKMITDMERIGDQALDISRISLLLSETAYIKKLEHIGQMAKETRKMIRDAIDAFVDKDLEKAHQVIEADDAVDALFLTVKEELILLINEDVRNGSQALDLLMIAKYYERIGDHAVNLAEWVEYSITGHHRHGLLKE